MELSYIWNAIISCKGVHVSSMLLAPDDHEHDVGKNMLTSAAQVGRKIRPPTVCLLLGMTHAPSWLYLLE